MANRDRTHIGFARWFTWHFLRFWWTPLAAVLFRPRVTGVESLPDSGYLLLANHTAAIDTLWVAAPTGRVLHFMTSAARFRSPLLGRVLTFFNCFPKAVGRSDPSATAAVKDLIDAGQVVQVMPEGTRTWDGRLNPIRSSIGRLVKDQELPVVLCRVQTGHLLWPRWAAFPRWVPLVIDYGPVQTWDSEVSAETIWQEIVEGLTLDTPAVSGATLSRRCAEGLETYLWACPVCFAQSTRAAGHIFSCVSCGEHWTVSLDLRLQGATPLTVAEAWDRIERHFGTPPRLSSARILSGALEVTVFDTGAAEHRGQVELTPSALVGGDWTVPLSSIKNVYLDAGNVVVLRMREGPQLQLSPLQQSSWLWYHFLSGWLKVGSQPSSAITQDGTAAPAPAAAG